MNKKIRRLKMKKYILTFAVTLLSLSAFAFDFYNGNFEVNTELEKEITSKINSSVEEEISKNRKIKRQEPEIVSLIREQMNYAMDRIKSNTKARKNIFTRAFVEEQEIQKQRYQNMLEWDVPNQLYMYIALNYDIAKVKNPMAACVYKDETIVEVRFDYCDKHIIVYYDYKYLNVPGEDAIREVVNPL